LGKLGVVITALAQVPELVIVMEDQIPASTTLVKLTAPLLEESFKFRIFRKIGEFKDVL